MSEEKSCSVCSRIDTFTFVAGAEGESHDLQLLARTWQISGKVYCLDGETCWRTKAKQLQARLNAARALADKWRNNAMRTKADLPDPRCMDPYGETFDECADDLEAALEGKP